MMYLWQTMTFVDFRMQVIGLLGWSVRKKISNIALLQLSDILHYFVSVIFTYNSGVISLIPKSGDNSGEL